MVVLLFVGSLLARLNVMCNRACRLPDPYQFYVLLAYIPSPRLTQQTTLALRVGALLRRLAAQLHVLDEEHPELAAVLPEPRTLTHTCVLREVDRQFMEALQVGRGGACVLGFRCERVGAMCEAAAGGGPFIEACGAAGGWRYRQVNFPA